MTKTDLSSEVAEGLRRLGAGHTVSVVGPDDPEFPHLRRLFRGRPRQEVLPLAVVRCAEAADVAAAVRFAGVRGMPFALRSGGHSFADFCDTDGLLIDLGRMDSFAWNEGEDTVVVGPGLRLGPLAEHLIARRRVVPCGWNPLVGVGGAVLGGGYGTLGRYFGLGCDHLRAAQVVLADGRTVWTDERREPELFWALRGAGGGNFGAVTRLVLETRAAHRLTSFVHRWPWRQAAEVVDAWQRWAPEAPDELNAELVLRLADTDPEPQVIMFGVAVGDAAGARPPLARFLSGIDRDDELTQLCELSTRMAYCRPTYAGSPVVAAMPDRLPPDHRPGLRVVRSEFFDRPMPPAAIEELLSTLVADRAPGQYRELEMIPWGGAFQRTAPDATAFVHRRARFQIGHHCLTSGYADQATWDAAHAWTCRSWTAAHPWANGGVYPNYPDIDLEAGRWAEAYYGANLPRLSRVKALYDPGNVFRFPHSVPLP